MRPEHWYDFGEQAGDSKLFVQVVAHIAAAAFPHTVLQYLRSGQVTPLAKPAGGHRPLLKMSFLRRLALKSVMAAKKESVTKCAGPLQYGVGRPDGTNTMIKTIQYLAGALRRPSRMSRGVPCSTALSALTLTSLLSSPDGTLSLQSTGCTSSPLMPRSVPIVVWIKDVLSLHVALLLPSTRSHDSCWLISADCSMMVPGSLPTSLTGTVGSSHSISLIHLS